jgi:tetratricopeptide (TPR) repeat protein
MAWPAPSDYQEAVQNPRFSFRDQPLQAGQPSLNNLGLPKVASGNFACVFEVKGASGGSAVRCFLREVTDQQRRYNLLSQHLQAISLPTMVGFQYLSEGIRVRGQWFPIVKMEWVDGQTLDTFVKNNLQNPNVLRSLAAEWRGAVAGLHGAYMAHGDLQHGNVLVDKSGKLRLVDYDALFIPALQGEKSPELGHSNYQHPERSATHYDPSVDNFASLVIYLSLLALAANPTLWNDFWNEDNLILTQGDFRNPGQSACLRRLSSSREPVVANLALRLEQLCAVPPDQVPDLENILQSPAIGRSGASLASNVRFSTTISGIPSTPAAESSFPGTGEAQKSRVLTPSKPVPGWAIRTILVLGLLSILTGVLVTALLPRLIRTDSASPTPRPQQTLSEKTNGPASPSEGEVGLNQLNAPARIPTELYQAALAAYNRTLALQPDDPNTLNNRGIILLRLGRYDEALADFNRALALRPDNLEILNNRGAALGKLGRYQEALADHNRSLALRPDYPEALTNRGAVLGNLGRHQEALADLNRVLALQPDDPEALHNRGITLGRMGRHDEALVDYNRALALRPDDPDTLYIRGMTLGQMGRNEEALADFNRTLALRPDNPDALSGRGNTLGQMGRDEEALADYNRALALQPNDPFTLHNRGVVLGNLGRYQEALDNLNRLLELEPDNPARFYYKAWLYSRMGSYEAALSWLRRAIGRDAKYGPRAAADLAFDPVRDHPLLGPQFRQLVGGASTP